MYCLTWLLSLAFAKRSYAGAASSPSNQRRNCYDENMFQSIGNIITVKTTPGLSRSLKAAMVVAKATEAGDGTWQATAFRKGRLTLVAPSPIEAQELVLRKEELKKQINTALGDEIVERLIIRSK